MVTLFASIQHQEHYFLQKDPKSIEGHCVCESNKMKIVADMMPRSMGIASDASADSFFDSSLIIANCREQMPEDIRSAFLPGDTIIFYKLDQNASSIRQIHAKNRRESSLVNWMCYWCRADNVCAGLILILTALIWLGTACNQNTETLAFHALRYALSGLWTMVWFLAFVLVYIQHRADGYSSVGLRCSQGVKLHCVHILASRLLSPSSLFLLQQPMLNLRSFCRYYKFFNQDCAGVLSDEEVDNCVRQLVFEDSPSLTILTGNESYALLGLEPCQDTFTGLGWGLSWPNVLYQSYRNWKRWRLATSLCEQIWAGDSGLLQHGRLDGHKHLARLGDRGGHKWFLVDPELFIPRIPSRQPQA